MTQDLQTWASVASALAAALGLGFVAWQVYQARTTIQGNTNAQLMGESLEILRFLADHPEYYDYFYKAKPPPASPSATLKCIAEMFANYMEHVVKQQDTMSEPEREQWSKFVRDTYRRSPVIGMHLREFDRWYDDRLLRLVEGLAHLSPSEI